MASFRLLLAGALLALSGVSASALDQREVGTGHLPPIDRTYREKIVTWGHEFFADRNALAGASVSSPLLVRDGTGRLLWLVCVDAPNAGPDLRFGGVQRFAFGFAPNFMSAPVSRVRTTLTREYCDEQPLVWAPLRANVKAARRR